MGVALKVLAVFVLIFMAVLWWDRVRGHRKNRFAWFLPILALVVAVFLSVLKIYIIYKIIILIVALGVGGLTYWHFKG